ncbi:hypothetical protein Mycch_5447 (plasmid) [Mycolicibacterium chubuense NBB4]|uniref:Uncharacterized protein n=1 Tax=Mycolicibacterium chubuense (strain NBB4) TaxID=710421 RepID=I4BS62_MYCCN|nr:hypothetical protein [Mycolicibacterium chubuense]AFM20119.1 hypothetical protein Mycch_5447 [Mycolicibacterium chubuense NBB4]
MGIAYAPETLLGVDEINLAELDLVGVPPRNHVYIRTLTNRSLGEYDPEAGETPEQGSAAAREFKDYGRELAGSGAASRRTISSVCSSTSNSTATA